MADDAVAELGEWLDRWRALKGQYRVGDDWPTEELMQRARDEIVGLRATVERQRAVLAQGHAEVRDAALEEAAHECDEEAKGSSEGFRDGCETCAAAIRLLRQRSPRP